MIYRQIIDAIARNASETLTDGSPRAVEIAGYIEVVANDVLRGNKRRIRRPGNQSYAGLVQEIAAYIEASAGNSALEMDACLNGLMQDVRATLRD